MTSRAVGRGGLLRRLEAIADAPGRAVYAGGVATIDHGAERWRVRPAFGLAHEGAYEHVEVGPLVAALREDHLVAVLLVRLGGYAAGVLDGERLVASKVGRRLVHGRHKAGGWSQQRFSRRREGEARSLHEEAAREAVRVLEPWLGRVQHASLGGDRGAVRATIAADGRLAPLAALALPRFLTVPDPRRDVLERVAFDVYAADLEIEALPADGA